MWGRLRDSDELWFLEDYQATVHREFVKDQVVCPVPGCAAQLTSVHSSRKRDHLRHLQAAGGHAPESVQHSPGCALTESWLRNRYPDARVKREEYSNERGERRADVLITAANSRRVAFEVQYSPLTPEAWQKRHDSYRSQGIVDVWLFGHASKQLRLRRDGTLRPNPTHEAVVRSGSALLFINPDPEREDVAFAVGTAFEINRLTGRDGDRVSVLGQLEGAQLEIASLATFRVDGAVGLTSERLRQLYEATHALPAQRR